MASIADIITSLDKKRKGMIAYLDLKVEVRDWHGVADAAMDLREIEAKLQALKSDIWGEEVG